MGIAGFVLAGGRSSRMGCNKAFLPHGGATLVEAIAAEVLAAAGSAAIIGDPHVFASLPHRDLKYQVYPDSTPGCGPISGIEAALLLGMAEWNLIVACDMPRLRSPHLTALLGAIDRAGPEAACVVPVTSEGPQPLCAVYRARALPSLKEAITRREYGLRRLLPALKPVWYEAVDASPFLNVNSPEEWAAFQSSL